MRYLFHSDVGVDSCGTERDFDWGLLAGGQEAGGWEGRKVGPQGSHIQCKLGAYVTIVLYLNPLCRLHQHLLSHYQQGKAQAVGSLP